MFPALCPCDCEEPLKKAQYSKLSLVIIVGTVGDGICLITKPELGSNELTSSGHTAHWCQSQDQDMGLQHRFPCCFSTEL